MPTGASFHPYEALATDVLVYRRALAALASRPSTIANRFGSAVSDAWAGDVGMAIASSTSWPSG